MIRMAVKRTKWLRLGLFAAMVGMAIFIFQSQQSAGAKVRPEDVAAATVPPSGDGTHPCVYATMSGDSMTTGVGRCATPTGNSGPVDRFETDLRYGAFVLRRTDLKLVDDFDVLLTRSYSSNDNIPLNSVHAFGIFSNHPYDIAPLGTRRPYTYLKLVLEDGDFLYFHRISEGGSFADAVYMHVETSTRFYKAILRWNGDGWTLRLHDGAEMRFPEAYDSKNMAQGAVNHIRKPNGEELVLERDAERNLHEIRTPHKQWLRFEYNGDTTIRKVEDDKGLWTSYKYHDGMLISVSDATGELRTYEYEGPLMTAARDQHGRMLVHNEFKSGMLVNQVFANGDTYHFEYKWMLGASHFDEVTVTLPNHSQTTVAVGEYVPAAIRSR